MSVSRVVCVFGWVPLCRCGCVTTCVSFIGRIDCVTVRRVLVIVQVVKGIMHVTTAGVVGSWWFSPHVRGDVVLQSIKQSVTTSFGSVCFGSLIVAGVQVRRASHCTTSPAKVPVVSV